MNDAGHKRDMRDVPARLEEPGNALVAKIVEMQIVDAEQLAGPREGRADGVYRVWEDAVAVLRLAQ